MRFCRAACFGGRKPSKKNRSVGSAGDAERGQHRRRARQRGDRVAGLARRAHQLVAGIGNQRRAGVGDQRDGFAARRAAPAIFGRASAGVVLVIGRERRGDAVVLGRACG